MQNSTNIYAEKYMNVFLQKWARQVAKVIQS